MPQYIAAVDYYCSCCLSFQLDTDFFSVYNPVPPLDPRCHLDMLCIFVMKDRWQKGVLGLKGEHTDILMHMSCACAVTCV